MQIGSARRIVRWRSTVYLWFRVEESRDAWWWYHLVRSVCTLVDTNEYRVSLEDSDCCFTEAKMEEMDKHHPWLNLFKGMAAIAGTYHAGLKLALYHANHTLLMSFHVGISIWLFSYGTTRRLLFAFMFAALAQIMSGSLSWSLCSDICFPCICFIGCLLCGSLQEET